MLFAFWTFPCLMLVLVSFPVSSEGLSFILKQLPVCLLFFQKRIFLEGLTFSLSSSSHLVSSPVNINASRAYRQRGFWKPPWNYSYQEFELSSTHELRLFQPVKCSYCSISDLFVAGYTWRCKYRISASLCTVLHGTVGMNVTTVHSIL